MNNDNHFIISARLEKGVLDVSKGDINSVALLGGKSDAVGVDLEVSDSLLASDVGSDHHVLQELFLALHWDKVVDHSTFLVLRLVAVFLLRSLNLLLKIFNLLYNPSHMSMRLVLHSKFLDEELVLLLGVLLLATWHMEVDSEFSEGLSSDGLRDTLDHHYVEGNVLVVAYWNEDCLMVLVHEYLAWFEISSRDLLLLLVALELSHVAGLVLSLSLHDLTFLKAALLLLQLLVGQLVLRFLPRFVVHLVVVILVSESGGGDHVFSIPGVEHVGGASLLVFIIVVGAFVELRFAS